MKSMTLSGRTLRPDGAFSNATVSVADGRITSVVAGIDARSDIVTRGWIVPGFIDLQVNGGFGIDLTADPAGVAQLADQLPATGVTGFLATLITSPLPDYGPMLQELELAARGAGGASILGIHLEGPYLSPQRAGAHNPAYLRTPDVDELEQWAGARLVRLVTLAPELPGALELIAHLVAHHVVVSAGHSNATYAQALSGLQAGVTWGTHLYNAMSPLAHREPGLVGALLSTEVPCGLIPDGIHSHPAAVKTAWRAKGTRGLTIVTDAMAAMGMSPGEYRLGDRAVTVDTTSARLVDGTLAGSILHMDAAVRNMITFTGCALADAITMASTTPARVIGLADRKGQIEPGYDADLVVLDEARNVALTLVSGETVYSRPSDSPD